MNTADTPTVRDAIIIGGSAAGLSAALMLGRARRRVLVIDAGFPRNRFADHMHGVLGNDGTSPADFVRAGRAEAAAYGVEFLDATVDSVTDNGATVTVTLTDGRELPTRALVVATGITDELPTIPGLAERWGTTVLHCPYCHGWEVRDRRLGVLATSPMALHQAKLVRQWSDHVTFFSAAAGELAPADEARLRARGVIVVTSPIAEVLGDGPQLTGVRTADGTLTPLDALFTAGAPRPHDTFLTGLVLARTDLPAGLGSFLTVDQAGATSHPRIWAAGNVINPMATVPMAVGAGALAGGAVNGALVEEDFDAAVGGC
ncbi:NAD(P)/FAD-dependent oxidoreductase [Leifsonia sp. PS1209]|uniref:NAD(P)/FAD-dependent oxidoreductase n=1 Tax=Leifsonia sp. PS1209 TaxID=2724914 RepID=UPI001442AA13|nr:NAD(P)/FAD-dependent oxidoreductase [Leifsonia sp. PS1209]QJA00236.1 NAD(P)/FAD-dependent oxidoreductase [Leifsonia sp. PS1209]